MGPIGTIVRVSPILHGISNNVSIHPVGETLPETTTIRTCQVAPYKKGKIYIYITFQHLPHHLYQFSTLASCLLFGELPSSTEEGFSNQKNNSPKLCHEILSFPNTMGHRPQWEKLPHIHCTMDTSQGKGVKVAHFPYGWKWGVGSSSNHNHGEISSPRPPKNLTTNAVQVRLLSFV